jgi:hypothetical protein
MDNTRPIRHVQNLDPLTADVVSAPTKELEERIRILENALSSFARQGTVSNVILQFKKIKSDVELYNTVYFNTASGLYEKAIAKVEFNGSNFRTLPTSLVVGIVVKIVGNTADILVDGGWPAAVFQQGGSALLEPGESFQSGKPYYLSSDYAGRLTFRPPALAVQVLMTTDDSILMNKIYGSPEGFEKSAKFEMGLRPMGGVKSIGNESRIAGFDGLESDTGTEWTKISNNPLFSNSNYMVAEGEALSVVNEDLWVEFLVNKAGHITVTTASSLAQLATPDIRTETFIDPASTAQDIPAAVTGANYNDVRTYVVRDANGVGVNRISFKLVCNHGETFDFSKQRSVIFKLPDSFMGWKEIAPTALYSGEADYKYQIHPYYLDSAASDYPDYEHIPVDTTLYYATKGDFGFVQNWPAEPLTKAIVMINGVEMSPSAIVESGLTSYFEDPKYDMGISTKTLYWPTSYVEASPWPVTYETIVSIVDGSYNNEAVITHRNNPDASSKWCWMEDSYLYEPAINKGWVYTNKLSIYSKSTRVLGVGVMPPLRVKDMITGLEPTYDGEPIGGNLLVWSDDKDNVISKVQDVDLGKFTSQVLYTNETKFNVAVKDITFVVRSQNNSQLTNNELGQVFTESDYAQIDIGTGTEGPSVYNILYREPVQVLEYNTSCVITIQANAAVIPPNGVVRLLVYKPFDVEQSVSIIFSGRTI